MKLDTATNEKVQADVVVVGGSAAGITAAIEAAKYGVNVVLINKGRVGFSGSAPTSDGETAAIFHPEDSPEALLKETLEGGEYLNVPKLVEILVKRSNQTVEMLEIFGVPYARDAKGKMRLYKELGQNYPRTPSVNGSGPAFTLALRKEALHRGVRFYENMMVHSLFLNKNSVSGCLSLDMIKGKNVLFNCKAMILAAGGATDLYPHATANYKTTGDGYWLGWNAGLEFINMEFVEFSVLPAPNGVPLSSGGIKPLTGRGARFYNSLGERFMERYDSERKELVKRSQLVYALYRETKEGRGPILMDLTKIPEEVYDVLENVHHLGILRKLRELGVDYRKEKFQWISPAVHTFLGGIRINEHCETSARGLYAAGENAGGVYGADRVGTYLTACATFGTIAGKNAARWALGSGRTKLPEETVLEKVAEIELLRKKSSGGAPQILKEKIRKIAGEYTGCERNEIGLKKAVKFFEQTLSEEIRNVRAHSPGELVQALEARNLCITGKMIAAAALKRNETRGQHRRVEYAESDPSWLKWLILKNEMGSLKIREEKIPLSSK